MLHTQNECTMPTILPFALDPVAQNMMQLCLLQFIIAAGPPALPQQWCAGGSHHGAKGVLVLAHFLPVLFGTGVGIGQHWHWHWYWCWCWHWHRQWHWCWHWHSLLY